MSHMVFERIALMKLAALLPAALLALAACAETTTEAGASATTTTTVAAPAATASADVRLAAAVAANGCTLSAENTAAVLAAGALSEDDITSAVTTLTGRGQVRPSGNALIFTSPGCA